MKKIVLWGLMFAIGLGHPFSADAFSCSWNGPFLTVSKDAPLIIHGRILRHHPGSSQRMSVFVLETLKGEVLGSEMVVQMEKGRAFRTGQARFPVGSEWILALNGPSSKSGVFTLSHCWEYRLRVKKGEVIGSIAGRPSEQKRMALDVLKRKIHYPRFQAIFKGSVSQGKRFQQPFGEQFVFFLEPMPGGWEVVVKEHGREENLARLTPPFHFVPNPRFIVGWHLLKGPSECPEREYLEWNAPGVHRAFIFSPEVGEKIDYPPKAQELEKVQRFGRGSLSIEKFKLQPAADGCPVIEWMEFSVRLEGGY